MAHLLVFLNHCIYSDKTTVSTATNGFTYIQRSFRFLRIHTYQIEELYKRQIEFILGVSSKPDEARKMKSLALLKPPALFQVIDFSTSPMKKRHTGFLANWIKIFTCSIPPIFPQLEWRVATIHR